MLVAYFDESGTHGKSARVTTVAGLVGDSIAWARLELPWKKRLRKDGVNCFHATDCAAGEGDFRRLSKPDQTEALSNDLATLIAQRELVAVGGAVYRDDWIYAASPLLKSQFRTTYHFCLSMVMLQVHDLSLKRGGGEPVAFVFARQDEYADYALSIHEVFQHNNRWATIGRMDFGSPNDIVPLQAADLYSYENYRELLTQLDEPGLKAPKRAQLQAICRSILVESRVAEIEFLHSYSEHMDGLTAALSAAPP
jgi:hypothetical protein